MGVYTPPEITLITSLIIRQKTYYKLCHTKKLCTTQNKMSTALANDCVIKHNKKIYILYSMYAVFPASFLVLLLASY